jgi:hypothetical protein
MARLSTALLRPRFIGDVGVMSGRIVAVGRAPAEGVREIDATGRIMSPGFIDLHTHYGCQVPKIGTVISPGGAATTPSMLRMTEPAVATIIDCASSGRRFKLGLNEGAKSIPARTEGVPSISTTIRVSMPSGNGGNLGWSLSTLQIHSWCRKSLPFQ